MRVRIFFSFCHQCLSSMWEWRDSTNHMRNHLKMMLVSWNAELLSGRLAEFEQVLCKLPEQPCMSVTLLFVCLAYVPCTEQGRQGLWRLT